MFILRDDIDHIDLADGEVLNFMVSINQPLVAAADRPPELTQSFVCSRQGNDGLINIFIMLHLVKSKLKVIYSLDQPLPMEMLREAEDEALTFTENMGFLMDSVPLAKFKKEEERKNTLAQFPIFQAGRPATPDPVQDPPENDDDVIEEIDIVEDDEMLAAGDEDGLSIEEAIEISEEEDDALDRLVAGAESEPMVEEMIEIEAEPEAEEIAEALEEPEPEIDLALEAAFPDEEEKPKDRMGKILRFLSSF